MMDILEANLFLTGPVNSMDADQLEFDLGFEQEDDERSLGEASIFLNVAEGTTTSPEEQEIIEMLASDENLNYVAPVSLSQEEKNKKEEDELMDMLDEEDDMTPLPAFNTEPATIISSNNHFCRSISLSPSATKIQKQQINYNNSNSNNNNNNNNNILDEEDDFTPLPFNADSSSTNDHEKEHSIPVISMLKASTITTATATTTTIPQKVVADKTDLNDMNNWGEWDIPLGRSQEVREYIGNVRFRDMVEQHRAAYHSTSRKPEKTAISTTIYNTIQNNGGRFMDKKKVPNTTKTFTWYEIPKDKALAKISQALRLGTRPVRKFVPPHQPEQMAYYGGMCAQQQYYNAAAGAYPPHHGGAPNGYGYTNHYYPVAAAAPVAADFTANLKQHSLSQQQQQPSSANVARPTLSRTR